MQAFLKRNNLGKYNEEEMERLRLEKEREDKEEADKMATMKIGDRWDMSHNSQIYTECQNSVSKGIGTATRVG